MMKRHKKPYSTIESRAIYFGVLIAAIFGPSVAPAKAQEFRSSICRPIASLESGIVRVSTTQAAASRVRVTYVSHASVRIQSSVGLNIATDYSGFDGENPLPDVVTMNRLHPGHFTREPDKKIDHVLRGWTDSGKPADHHVRIGDAVVRNVTTDFNSRYTGVIPDANSIFVFEVDGLCIGHLGHLHHLPTDEDYAQIGRLDVVMVPVDGVQTLKVEEIQKIAARLGSRYVVPIHWFNKRSLLAFLEEAKTVFPIDGRNENAIDISLSDLPKETTMLVLTPETSFPLFAK